MKLDLAPRLRRDGWGITSHLPLPFASMGTPFGRHARAPGEPAFCCQSLAKERAALAHHLDGLPSRHTTEW